jgi:hypothetical protein
VCYNTDLVFTGSVSNGTLLEWTNAGGGTVTGNQVKFAKGVAAGVKTVVARATQTTNSVTCTGATVTQSATVHPAPSISLASGVASQTVIQGQAITPIVYAAANATGIGSGSTFPTGVTVSPASYAYTIQGTPVASGTFAYTVNASAATVCPSASAAGTLLVVPNIVAITTTKPSSYVSSNNAWVIAGITVSDKVNDPAPTGCLEYNSTNFHATDKLFIKVGSVYYYSYACMNNNISKWCGDKWSRPDGHRLPVALVQFPTTGTNSLPFDGYYLLDAHGVGSLWAFWAYPSSSDIADTHGAISSNSYGNFGFMSSHLRYGLTVRCMLK